MNKKIKNILLSVLAVLIIVVGSVLFPDTGDGIDTADTVSDILEDINDTDEIPSDTPPQDEPQKPQETEAQKPTETIASEKIDEDGEYLSRDDVALYIHTYGKLPKNFMTKNEAEALGWVSSKGNLWKVAPGCAIGGDKFGNYEGLLPKKNGRKYYECDVDFDGGYRDAKRIVFSNDGLIFYTDDHYESFTQLYGD